MIRATAIAASSRATREKAGAKAIEPNQATTLAAA